MGWSQSLCWLDILWHRWCGPCNFQSSLISVHSWLLMSCSRNVSRNFFNTQAVAHHQAFALDDPSISLPALPCPFFHPSGELLFILQSLLKIGSPNRICLARYFGIKIEFECCRWGMHIPALPHPSPLPVVSQSYSISFITALTFYEKRLSVPFRQK